MFSITLLTFLLHSLFLGLPLYAIPLYARGADDIIGTITTVQTAASPMGSVVMNCSSVVTQVEDADGKDVVREVTTCVLALDGSQSPVVPSIPITSTSAPPALPSPVRSIESSTSIPSSTLPPFTSPILPPTASPLLPPTTSPILPPTTSPILPPTTSPTPPLTSSLAPLPPPTSSPPPLPPPPSPSTSSTPSPPATTSPLNIGNPISTTTTSTTPLPPRTQTSSTSVQPSAAAVSAVTESSLPGKKLSVLPIGLGVFAGISVVALIVVAMVTFERTRYRKAFRQRKLAESAAPMGYGGMNSSHESFSNNRQAYAKF